MLLPKIVYNAITLSPTWPPINKRPESSRAERTDIFSSAGVKQSNTQRVDHLLPLEFQIVPTADIAGWQTFMDTWALLGKPFDYYPDATSGTHTTYYLEDTDFDPKFMAKGGWYQFTITLRRQIT